MSVRLKFTATRNLPYPPGRPEIKDGQVFEMLGHPTQEQPANAGKWIQMYPDNFVIVTDWLDDESKAVAPAPENKAAATPSSNKAAHRSGATAKRKGRRS